MHTITLPVALVVACTLGAHAGEPRTASEFLADRKPTFVVGTLGDDSADRGVSTQVELVRGLLFPEATVVGDDSFDVSAGAQVWPRTPVLYGGGHLNAALAGLGDCLPLKVTGGEIAIAGQKYTGDEYRLIALVPSLPASDSCPGSPQFLLYAGAGTPGVTEINATPDGNFGFVVIDRFGVLDAGTWERGADGAPFAKITTRALRKPWRESVLRSGGISAPPALIVERLEVVPQSSSERAEDAALMRGLRQAESALGLENSAPITVYVYPDAKTKASITRPGDGHADQVSRTLHVINGDAGDGGALEKVCAHEVVHILATDAFGVPGSPLWGEGLAVWASRQYGSRTLTEWRLDPPRAEPGIVELCGAGFSRLPERVSYPIAGLLVDELIHEHGFEAFIQHVYPVGPGGLEAALASLDADVQEVDAILRRFREN
ncbi:MAG: hypothetical protein KDC14_05665 [Planctomycetes bacterium]|nr:hypothetical protein [Planctomycetota bacterium]